MTGPQPRGTWTGQNKPESWSMLHPRHAYRVTQAFRDYDGTEHPVGEQWTFLGFNFLPYDDGLSLFVSLDGEQEWHIRMQLRPEEQGSIVNNLAQYILALHPIRQPGNPAGQVVSPPSNRSTHLLLAASFLALVLGFVILHISGDGTRSVAPTDSSLEGGLAGVAVLAGGFLLGLVGIIRLVRPDRVQQKP